MRATEHKNSCGLVAKVPAPVYSNAWPWYGLGILIYAGIFWFWQVEPVPTEVYAAGILLWAVALAPLAVWYQRGRKGVPIFELICLAYGLSYGPTIYLAPNEILILSQQVRLPWLATMQCVFLATLGLGLLITGYYLMLYLLGRTGFPRMDLPLVGGARGSYIHVALAIGLSANLFIAVVGSGGSAYGAILNALAGQLNIGLVLLAYEVFAARESDGGRLTLLSVCAGVGVMLGLIGGTLEGVVLPLVLVFIVRWHVRRKFPAVLAAAVAMLFLALNPLKHEFRERAWYGELNEGGVTARLGIWVQLAQERLRGERDGLTEGPGGFSQSVQRVDLLHKFVHVKTLTPGEVPFLDGVSYQYMVYTYIPRFLWAEKPVVTEATDLVDFAYGFRSPLEENKGTKIAIGQIAEAYANLGIIGIVIVMLVQGILFAVLNHLLNGPNSVGGRAIYLATMVAFLNGIGTSAVILFGAMFQFVVASALLMRLFASGFTTTPAGTTNATPQRPRQLRVKRHRRNLAVARSPDA